jgi:integrase
MDAKELSKEPLVIDWFANIEAAKFTQRNFLQGMQLYTDYVKKTPAELLDEAETEIKTGVLMRKRKIRDYLLTYREYLKGKGYAPKTAHNHFTAVKSFYRSFDIDLPVLNHKKAFRALATEENNGRLEKEHLQAILKFANVRNKAIVLALASSGLSQSDLLDLTVGDFKRGIDEKTMITTLELRRIKTRYDFITFLSPESTKAIQDYLEYRNRKPKNPRVNVNPERDSYLIAWEKRRIRSDRDYLFCSNYIPPSYLKTLDEAERRLTPEGLMDTLRELAKKSGLDTAKGQWQLVRAHNLRKFFNSQLLNNGADIFFTDFLMGHKIDSVHEAYFRADPKKLKERYMRYLPFLALTDTETYVIETEEYAKLKKENETLKANLESGNAELKRDYNELKKQLDFLTAALAAKKQ